MNPRGVADPPKASIRLLHFPVFPERRYQQTPPPAHKSQLQLTRRRAAWIHLQSFHSLPLVLFQVCHLIWAPLIIGILVHARYSINPSIYPDRSTGLPLHLQLVNRSTSWWMRFHIIAPAGPLVLVSVLRFGLCSC